MAKVSFGSLDSTQLATKKGANAIVIGRIYFVLTGSAFSIVKGTSVNTVDTLYEDAIASRPKFNSKGYQLAYLDSTGSTKIIDLSTLTVGDRSAVGSFPLSYPDGQYMGTLGAEAASPDNTALPTTGVRVNDFYKCVTAGTYSGVVLVVGDIVKATAVTPTWAKNNTTILPVGVIQQGDSLQIALARIVNNMDDMGASISEKATKLYVDNEFWHDDQDLYMSGARVLYLDHDPTLAMHAATKQYVDATVVSFMKLQTSPASVAVFNALTGIKVGYSYRITVAGTYSGQVCEIGDVIVAIAVTTGVTATTTWMVLQNNLDLAGIFTTAGNGLAEDAGAGGKTIKMPTISQTNTTTGSATLAHGGTVTIVDSITRDSYGRVTGINTKTMTMPSETVLSGLTTNAQAAYKIMVNMTSSGHALTATYTDVLLLAMTGWTTDANVGSIVVGDTLKGALNRLQNRNTALETRATAIELLQDWIVG